MNKTPATTAPREFPLVWFVEDEDAHENPVFAASAWRVDGAGMDLFFRIKHAVVAGRHCYGEASSAELIEDTDCPRTWPSLSAAKNAMQRDHNAAMNILGKERMAA